MKKTFLHGIISGILATAASVIYANIYQKALGADFGKIVTLGGIAGTTIFACLLMALTYWVLWKINKPHLTGVLNIVIALVSFATIIGPIGMSLPLDIHNPELFPGLVVPMHFFPALAFFCVAPFFHGSKKVV